MALVVKNPPANSGDVRDTGLTPGLGRAPGWRHGNPLQYSCLENPMDRGAWRATVHRVTEWATTEVTQYACTHVFPLTPIPGFSTGLTSASGDKHALISVFLQLALFLTHTMGCQDLMTWWWTIHGHCLEDCFPMCLSGDLWSSPKSSCLLCPVFPCTWGRVGSSRIFQAHSLPLASFFSFLTSFNNWKTMCKVCLSFFF